MEDTLGTLVAGMQASVLEEIPATAFKNIRQFKSLKLGRIQRRVVVSKVRPQAAQRLISVTSTMILIDFIDEFVIGRLEHHSTLVGAWMVSM